MTAASKAPVSRRALIQRLNRSLADVGLIVRKSTGERALKELGEYYVVDLKRNEVTEKNSNLEKLGRKYKVLAPWEELC